MTPEKKQFLPFKAAAATVVAMGVFAPANGAETETSAPIVVTAPAPAVEKAVSAQPTTLKRFIVTSGFEDRPDPFIHGLREAHKGTDFAAPVGTAILLPLGNATVKDTGSNDGFGKYIDVSYGLDNDGNEVSLRFAHLGKIAKGIKKGASVEQGQQIASVGMTGHTEGAHVHLGFSVNNKLTDLAMFDGRTVPAWTTQPSADMLDVVQTGRGRKATYALTSTGEGPSILAALDPEMAGIVHITRKLEEPKNSGDPICVEHDGHKNLSCGGLNAIAMGIAPEVLRTYKEKDFQRAYERLYIDYGVRRVLSVEKLNYFANAVNFGVGRAKEMLAEAGSDETKQLKLTALRYNRVMIKNPDLFYNYRDGWNDDRMTKLWAASGTKHPFHEFELITSLPKTLLASSGKKTASDKKAVIAQHLPPAPAVVAQSPHWVLAQATPHVSPWDNLLNPQINLQPADVSRNNLLGRNTAPVTIASATNVSPTAMMRATESTVSAPSDTAGKIIGGVLTLAGVLAAALTWGKGLLSKIKAIPAAMRTRPKKVKASPAVREPVVAGATVTPLVTRRAMPARAASAPEVIRPALIEAVQAAAASRAAHTEPQMTIPADILASARQEPTVTLAGRPDRSTAAMTDASQVLRAKHSVPTDGEGYLRIDYSDGSSVVRGKERTTMRNVHPSEDKALELTLRDVAQRYKGNFKVKIKGDTAKERYQMAQRVRKAALRLGLIDRLVTVSDDNLTGTMTMRAHTAAPELRPQPQRPAAKATEPDFLELKRA